MHVRNTAAPAPADADLIDFFIRKYDEKATDPSRPDFHRATYDTLVRVWRRRLADHATAAGRLIGQVRAEQVRSQLFEVDLRDHATGQVALANKEQAAREQAVLAAWPRLFERERGSGRHEELRETNLGDWTWVDAWEMEPERKYLLIGNATMSLRYPYYRDFEQARPPLLLADREDPEQYRRVT